MRLVQRAHQFLGQALSDGDLAIDATAGNGRDTAFLASRIGSMGKVFAFDVQQEAIESTRSRLEQDGLLDRVSLHLCSHDRMKEKLPLQSLGKVSAIAFNLGYLPGGNKEITATPETTTRALISTCALLRSGGILTLIAYRGHFGGREECDAARAELERSDLELEVIGDCSEGATSPLLFIARKTKINAPTP